MTVERTADAAMADVLLTLLGDIEANLAGTLADTDPECLHDLRVGIRRTRSLLKLTGDVLPRGLGQRYAARFKWLGELTTPVRDLDVHLLAFDELAADVPASHRQELEPFREHLRRQRSMRFDELTHGLSGDRFTKLREGWREELAAAAAGSGGSAQPEVPTVGELAAERIGRAGRAVRRRARALTPDSPSDALHDLRKRAKELRYLLETFAPPHGKSARKAIKELKRVQDVLGSYQDAQVQLSAVREYAAGLDSTPAAVDELAAALGHRQEQARTDLGPRLSAFLSR
ncbi:MAG TPA: CHAD domain-containing protein [Streptosporangiales bacterium]